MPRLLKFFILVFSFAILVLRFSISASAQPAFPPVNEAKVADLANRWLSQGVGQPRLDMLPTVISLSQSAGIDPNFTIAVWLHETGASNYAGVCQIYGQSDPGSKYCQRIQDFGYNSPQYETQIDVQGKIIQDHFLDQLNAFLNLPGAYAGQCGCADMYSFMALYRTGDSCTPGCGDIGYLKGIKQIYGWLTGDPNLFPNYPKPGLAKTCSLSININSCSTAENPSIPSRPNPFDLVQEEKDRPISDPNLAPFCAYRPTVVKTLGPGITGTLFTNFSSLTTPFLSAPGSSIGDKRYLADYLEGEVLNKLAPQSYQDQLKNAMIQRASANANPAAINQAYGFPTATTQIHDYELNTPYGKFKLSQLKPKPFDDPEALVIWQNSPTAQAWPYVPMFTREDTKGFIQSLPEPDQISSPQTIEVIHPHLARTYEASSAIANLLSPESTHLFQKPSLPINWVQPAPWTTDSHWLDSSQSVPAEYGPLCNPQEPTKVIAGPGEPARGGQIITSVSKSFAATDDLAVRFSPVYLETFTPFLDKIAFNLLTGPGALFGIFNPTNEKPENWPAVGNDSQKAPTYSFSAGQTESGLKKPGRPTQYLYNYLGSLHCQKEKLIAGIQPFLTGATYDLPPECTGKSTSSDPNAPIGPITSTCADTNNVFIWQRNPNWTSTTCPNNPYAPNCASDYPTCTIGLSGCGSASIGMILNSFNANANVESVWQNQHQIGGYVYGGGSFGTSCGTTYYAHYPNSEGALPILEKSGLSVSGIGTDWDEAEKILQSCGLILTSGQMIYPCEEYGECRAGHIIVITGLIKNNGQVTHIETMDPWFSNGDKLVQELNKDYAVTYMWGTVP